MAGATLLIIIVVGGLMIYKNDKPNSPPSKNPDNPSSTPLNKLSDKELEKCLLEDFSRRLDLKKYFVFNLQKEVKPGKHSWSQNGTQINVNNGRDLVPSLSNHLTSLIGSKKT
jgi:hypothetical protein